MEMEANEIKVILCTYLRSCMYLSPLAISNAILVSLIELMSIASLQSLPTKFLLDNKNVFKSPEKYILLLN